MVSIHFQLKEMFNVNVLGKRQFEGTTVVKNLKRKCQKKSNQLYNTGIKQSVNLSVQIVNSSFNVSKNLLLQKLCFAISM